MNLNVKNNRREARVSKAIREAAGLPGTRHPIEDVDGFEEPAVVGKRYHYTTKTGIPVRHPSAYAKKGWSTLTYHGSTLRIRVGRGWIIENTEI